MRICFLEFQQKAKAPYELFCQVKIADFPNGNENGIVYRKEESGND